MKSFLLVFCLLLIGCVTKTVNTNVGKDDRTTDIVYTVNIDETEKVIKSGVRIALPIAIERYKEKNGVDKTIKHAQAIVLLVKNILDVLSTEESEITIEQIKQAFDPLDKKLSLVEKYVIQEGINSIIAFVKRQTGKEELNSDALRLLRTLFTETHGVFVFFIGEEFAPIQDRELQYKRS